PFVQLLPRKAGHRALHSPRKLFYSGRVICTNQNGGNMQSARLGKKKSSRVVKAFNRALGAAFLLLLGWPLLGHAQSPAPAASGAAKSNSGLFPGWNMGVRFEGSTSGDGSVYDLGFGTGYNFTHHFGVGLGVPYYFVGTPSTIKSKDPQAVSGSGLGDIGVDLRWLFPGEAVTYASIV